MCILETFNSCLNSSVSPVDITVLGVCSVSLSAFSEQEMLFRTEVGLSVDGSRTSRFDTRYYNFINSYRRNAILIRKSFQDKEAHKRTFKRVYDDTTRSWRSAEDGLTTLI